MKNGLTYIIFVIDRSGSMESIRNDMIGGFNSFIKSQQEANIGECRVFAYKFDTAYEPMFEDLDLNFVPVLTRESYVPRGGTALYDSLGRVIDNIGQRLSNMSESERPAKVLVVTITDGAHNSNLLDNGPQFTAEEVKEKVKHQTEVYSWDFAYIGANQDAWAVGNSMGYSQGTTLNYVANSSGSALMFNSLSDSTVKYRTAAVGSRFCFSKQDDDKVSTP